MGDPDGSTTSGPCRLGQTGAPVLPVAGETGRPAAATGEGSW